MYSIHAVLENILHFFTYLSSTNKSKSKRRENKQKKKLQIWMISWILEGRHYQSKG